MRISLAGGPPQEVLRNDRLGNIQCARPPSSLCLYHLESETELKLFRFDPVTGRSELLPQFKIEKRGTGWNLSPDGKILETSIVEGSDTDPSFNLYSLEDGSRRTIRLKTWTGIGGLDFAADSKSMWLATYENSGKSALL